MNSKVVNSKLVNSKSVDSKFLNSKFIVSMLFACATPAMAHAAQPSDAALLKQCESAQEQVEEECKKVAREMMKPPEAQPERTDKTGQDVTHSSPVMDTESQQTPPKEAHSKQTQPKQTQARPAKQTPPAEQEAHNKK